MKLDWLENIGVKYIDLTECLWDWLILPVLSRSVDKSFAILLYLVFSFALLPGLVGGLIGLVFGLGFFIPAFATGCVAVIAAYIYLVYV